MPAFNRNTTYQIAKIITKFEELFDETLGTWKTDPLEFELQDDSKLIFSIPHTVPKVYTYMFKKQVGNLVLLGVLERSNDSEWVAPSFAKLKSKTNQVLFLSYFINLNIKLKRKTDPIKYY